MAGCGTTREKLATEQLLLSDAVDQAISAIDFSPLAGETVFLDTQYVRALKTQGIVNADYIISSLRQQMVLAGCLLQEDREQADFVAEARVGTLGTNGHDVNYGIPASSTVNAAASIVSSSPAVPALPEISLARKSFDSAATKLAVFAYHRDSKLPVWQSGLSVARSRSESKWILGAGPFQSGEIHEGTLFAGKRLEPFGLGRHESEVREQAYRSAAVLSEELQSKLTARMLDSEDGGSRVAQLEERAAAEAGTSPDETAPTEGEADGPAPAASVDPTP